MPVFNGEKYIKESIESILNSDFIEFELIIINDGSTDNSEFIIKSFDDKRIRYFHKVNTGICETLNFGLSKANFDLIARIDCDDLMFENRLSVQFEFFNKNNVDVVGSNAIIINQDGFKIKCAKMPSDNLTIQKMLKSFESPMIHPSVMYRKESVLAVGGYKENYADDYDLWLRMIDKYKFANIESNLIYLRKHDNNLSKTKIEKAINTKYKSLYSYYDLKQDNSNLFKLYKMCLIKAINSQNFISFLSKFSAEVFKRAMLLRIKFLNFKL